MLSLFSKRFIKIKLIDSIRSVSNYQEANYVVLTDDGSTIVCWHPKEDVPYEFTKPIPEEQLTESDSILKNTLSPALKSVFKKKHPDVARDELAAITFTTKHKWFPRSRDKKAKKTPMDREYL